MPVEHLYAETHKAVMKFGWRRIGHYTWRWHPDLAKEIPGELDFRAEMRALGWSEWNPVSHSEHPNGSILTYNGALKLQMIPGSDR